MKQMIVTALVMASCAHAVDPGVRAQLPHPAVANATHGEETFAGAGGVMLYGQWWRPAAGDVRAVLVVQHGLNDHGDRYAGLAEVLVGDGIAVYALDLPGHGRSAGPRTTVSHFHDYESDEETWISRIRDKEPGKPLWLFGHSMGGLIMTLYAEDHPDQVGGVILSAPALGVDAPPLQIAALQLAAHLGAPGHMLPQHDADFSRDPAVVAAMGADPLLPHGDGPTHTAVELIEAIRVAWAHADRLTAPILIVHGSADRLTSPVATRDFLGRVSSKEARHELIAGAWHDLTHDPLTPRVVEVIGGFLDASVPGGRRWNVLANDDNPPRHVNGTRTPSATAVELGGVIAASTIDSSTAPGASYGELRARTSLGGGPIAYHADLAIRIRDGVGIDLLPLGVAHRIGRAGEISLAGGIAAGWPGGWGELAIPARVQVELPFGPSHVLARATASWVVRGAAPPSRTLGADALGATIAWRFGGERDYWSRVSAGSGPFVGATWARSAGVDVWGVVLGVHLWGVD